MANIPVTVKASNPPRGSGTQATSTFVAQAMRATFSWGVSPGTATLTYVGNAAPIQTGALITLTIGAHYFAGLCKSDVETKGATEGLIRTLSFVDLREFLKWDWTFGCFNKPDVRLFNGLRVKRYKHIYPEDFDTGTWTFTNSPLTVAEILNLIFTGPTIGTGWTMDYTGNGVFPAGLFNEAIYDLDYLNGKRLDAVLGEVCEKTGTVVGLESSLSVPYKLVFTRKGFGPDVGIPDNSDNRRVGVALSDNPTNIRILGDRNCYQVMDVPLQYDWARGWETFMVFELFADDIYHRALDPTTGFTYDQTANDPEGYVGRQLATARAMSITVREYAALRTDGGNFLDNRKFNGRWRNDMPAALYIAQVVFRAFRPASTFELSKADWNGTGWDAGDVIPLTSLDIADQLLCRVYQDDPTDGTMQFDITMPTDGNGYAIAKGYQVGADLFKNIRSDQFTLDFFSNSKAIWQHIPFQVDDSGEGVRFIIFDEPVIVSETLITNVDGHRVINAGFSLDIPQVKATLVFVGEKFSYWKGTYPEVSRDSVETVGGLNLEAVVSGSGYTEIPYANFETSISKADRIGAYLLLRQFYYAEGGFRLIWDPSTLVSAFGMGLTGLIDRVEIVTSPKEGTYEVVDLTNERQREVFEPERELDRRTQTNALFPGQAALRFEAENARKLAAAFRENPRLGQQLRDLLNGAIGSDDNLSLTWFGGAGLDALGSMPVGTVIRKAPTTIEAGGNSNTIATNPAAISDADSVFMGVTVRHNENPAKPFKVQASGSIPVRVQGPVKVNDTLGLASAATGWEYLVKDGTPSVGRAEQEITDDSVQLIRVSLAVGGSGTAITLLLKSMESDYLVCHSWDDATLTEGTDDIYVAKEEKHRNSLEGETEGATDFSYGYGQDPDDPTGLNVIRTKSGSGTQEQQRILPMWGPDEVINAIPAQTGLQTLDGTDVGLLIVGRSGQWSEV